MNKLRPQHSADEDICLDLSMKKGFVLVFFAVSDPGHEYEIVPIKDIEYFSPTGPKEDDTVTVKYGAARCQGTVIKVSDSFKFLKENSKWLVKMHQNSLKREYTKIYPKRAFLLENRRKYMEPNDDIAIPYKTPHKEFVLRKNCITSERITTNNKANQKDQHLESSDSDSDTDMETKYAKLETKYQKIYSLVVDLKKNMEELSKEMNLKTGKKRNIVNDDEDKENDYDFSKMIQIGSKGTKISKQVYDSINWSTYTTATRKLLVTLFPRKVLATHSLTGKPSPAFLTTDREAKERLNPHIISDIVQVVSRKSKVTESLVRSAITTKCADENKLYKKRLEKGSEEEEENISNKKKKTA